VHRRSLRRKIVVNCEKSVETMVALHEEQIQAIREWQHQQNGKIDEIQKSVQEIKTLLITENAKIQSQILKEQNKKPSWWVSVLITTLASICTGLIVYIVSY
jgi:predicted PurR-regulated permease PerM